VGGEAAWQGHAADCHRRSRFSPCTSSASAILPIRSILTAARVRRSHSRPRSAIRISRCTAIPSRTPEPVALHQQQHHGIQQRRRLRRARNLRRLDLGRRSRDQHLFDLQRPPAYTLDTASGYPLNSGPTMRRLAVGFRTGDHTGSSVPITAEGSGAFLFTGYMDESDIFFKMAFAISSDTTDADKLVDTLSGVKFPKTFGK